jgi:hypothetical protein
MHLTISRTAGNSVKNAIIFMLVLGALVFGGTKWHMHKKVGDTVDIAVLMMAPFVEITYEGVSSTLSGQLTVDGVRARISGFKDEILIDRIGIDTPNFLSLLKLADITSNPQAAASDMPEYFGFIAEGVRMPVNADYFREIYQLKLAALGVVDSDDPAAECVGKYGFSPKALAGLGYSEQVVSVAVIFRQQGSRFVLDISSSADQMWDVDAQMTLAGDMVTEFSKGSAYRPRMSDLRIEYADRSLNGRIRKYCASRGLTEQEIFAAQMDAFTFIGEANGIVFDEYMIGPYEEFLGGKTSLVITAKPSEPVTLSQLKLYKPSDVPALLDLTATAM